METVSDSSRLNKILRPHYLSLPQGDYCQVSYIWLDGSGQGLRSKTKTLDKEPESIEGNRSPILQNTVGAAFYTA